MHASFIRQHNFIRNGAVAPVTVPLSTPPQMLLLVMNYKACRVGGSPSLPTKVTSYRQARPDGIDCPRRRLWSSIGQHKQGPKHPWMWLHVRRQAVNCHLQQVIGRRSPPPHGCSLPLGHLHFWLSHTLHDPAVTPLGG